MTNLKRVAVAGAIIGALALGGAISDNQEVQAPVNNQVVQEQPKQETRSWRESCLAGNLAIQKIIDENFNNLTLKFNQENSSENICVNELDFAGSNVDGTAMDLFTLTLIQDDLENTVNQLTKLGNAVSGMDFGIVSGFDGQHIYSSINGSEFVS